MSNPLKSIGKIFKKVVKVVKRVALPALAIGAVILTGGAALGALPALGGAGGLLASAGISGPLAGIMTSAANSAVFGALGAAVTGKNILKGATTGFLVGGASGAVGLGIPGPASGKAASAAGSVGAVEAAPSLGVDSITLGRTAVQAPTSLSSSLSTLPGVAAPPTSIGLGAASSAAPAAAFAAPTSGAASAAFTPAVSTAASQGGLMGALNNNPTLAGMAIQGLGGGLMAASEAKERRREAERRAANYSDTSGLFRLTDVIGEPLADAGKVYDQAVYGRMKYDPSKGTYVQQTGAA